MRIPHIVFIGAIVLAVVLVWHNREKIKAIVAK